MTEFGYNPETHEYTIDGKQVLSVTKVLKMTGLLKAGGNDFDLYMGQARHKAIELHNHGKLDESQLDHRLIPALEAWKEFVIGTGFTVIDSERKFYNQELWLATTVDVFGQFPDMTLGLIEVKSGAVAPWVGLQTAGQALAMRSPKFVKRYGLKVGNGRPTVKPFADADDYKVFQSALNVAHWMQTH